MAHASELVAQIGALKVGYAEHPVHILYTDYSKAKGPMRFEANWRAGQAKKTA